MRRRDEAAALYCDVEPSGIPGDWVAAERRAAAAHAAVVAAERHADLRTRFAVALASSPRGLDVLALYDLADDLATEDARRREADGVR